MFVLRNIINHEVYCNDVNVDGDETYGAAGWVSKEELEKLREAFVEEKIGKYYVDDWGIIEMEDKLYYLINHQLNNDNDFKAYYYNSGTYEILNGRTGKLTRHDKYE